MAKREAQAHAIAPPTAPSSAIERAQQALAERVKAFTEASEALREEIRAFEAACAEARGRSPEPVLRLVVSRETAEMEAIDKAGEAAPAGEDRPSPEQIAEFFRTHEEREGAQEEASAPPPLPEAEARSRNLARERLYADLCGAAIGLCGAAAVINFVLLR